MGGTGTALSCFHTCLKNLVQNFSTHTLCMSKVEQDNRESLCRMQFISRKDVGMQEIGNDAKPSVVITEFC